MKTETLNAILTGYNQPKKSKNAKITLRGVKIYKLMKNIKEVHVLRGLNIVLVIVYIIVMWNL